MKGKTKAQKRLLRKYRMWPWLWVIINDRKGGLLVLNWLTGEFRMLNK